LVKSLSGLEVSFSSIVSFSARNSEVWPLQLVKVGDDELLQEWSSKVVLRSKFIELFK